MRRRPIRAPWEGEFMQERKDHIKIIKDPIVRCIHNNDKHYTLYVEQYLKNQKGQLWLDLVRSKIRPRRSQ